MAPPSVRVPDTSTTVFITNDPATPFGYGNVTEVDTVPASQPAGPLRDDCATRYMDTNADGRPDVQQWNRMNWGSGETDGFACRPSVDDTGRALFNTAKEQWARVADVVNNGFDLTRSALPPPHTFPHAFGVTYELDRLRGCRLYLYMSPLNGEHFGGGSFVRCESGAALLQNATPMTFVFPITEVKNFQELLVNGLRPRAESAQ